MRFWMVARHTGHFCICDIRPQSAQQHTCAHGANAMVALACMHTTHALPGSPPPVPAAMLPSALLTELTLVWLADASSIPISSMISLFRSRSCHSHARRRCPLHRANGVQRPRKQGILCPKKLKRRESRWRHLDFGAKAELHALAIPRPDLNAEDGIRAAVVARARGLCPDSLAHLGHLLLLVQPPHRQEAERML